MSSNPSVGEVCTSQACVHIASDILWSMAPNYTEIDPCTDFDQYACAGWDARTQIPSGQIAIEPLTLLTHEVNWELKQILEGPYPTGSDGGWITASLTDDQVKADKENFETLQKAYNACLNQTAIAEYGVEPLVKVLEDIMEWFPVEDTNNKTPKRDEKAKQKVDLEALAKTTAQLQKIGISTFFMPTVMQDDTNPETNLLALSGPTFTEFPTTGDESTVKELIKLGATLLKDLHPGNITTTEATLLAAAVADLEQKLAISALAAQTMEAVLTDPAASLSKVSLEELNETAPSFRFHSVLETIVPQGYTPDTIIIGGEDYFKNTSLLIEKTSPQVLQTFFLWRAMVSLAEYVDSDITTPWNRFQTTQRIGAGNGRPARWQTCVSQLDLGPRWVRTISPLGTSQTLTWGLTRFFLDKHYSEEARNFTKELAVTLKEEFGSRILERDWLTNKTKTAAKEKVDKIATKIGFPDESPNAINPESLAKFYEDLNITESYFFNAISAAEFAVNKTFAQLGQAVNRAAFNLLPTTTANAYYNPPLNEIVILAGIQQFPLFDYEFPSYLTYGGMGSIVAHEITHGFDNRGRNYDASGNKTLWWDRTSVAAFENRTACFVKQFGEYTVKSPNGTEVHVSGKLTLPENIADSGGVATSFGAWKRMQRKQKRDADKKLPGLEGFSGEQLFFVKWAQNWCSNRSPEAALAAVQTDSHAPGKARIKGPLANSKDFLEAFNCPVKRPKCELW